MDDYRHFSFPENLGQILAVVILISWEFQLCLNHQNSYLAEQPSTCIQIGLTFMGWLITNAFNLLIVGWVSGRFGRFTAAFFCW
jgi:hypothetical protein